jgi:membrane-bound lytic murein transglycosylase A
LKSFVLLLLILNLALPVHGESLADKPNTPKAATPPLTDAEAAAEKKFQDCLFPPPKPPSPNTTNITTGTITDPGSKPASPNTPASPPKISAPGTTSNFAVVINPGKALAAPAAEARPTGPTFHKIDPKDLPVSMGSGELSDIQTALRRQLTSCDAKKADDTVSFKIKTAGQLTTKQLTRQQYCNDTNTALLKLADSATSVTDLMTKARDKFDWYQSDCEDGKGSVLFTGYHGPILDARHTRQGLYQVPILRAPDELKQIRIADLQDKKTCESYLARPEIVTKKGDPTVACMQDGNGTFTPPDRGAIIAGAFRNRETGKKGLAIGYVKSDLEVYLLQVEGAGTLQFSDKDFVYVNTGEALGFKRIMMGHVLDCRGIPKPQWATAEAQRKYFEENPKELEPDLKVIRNYLFFDDTKKGLLGADNIELSGASVATSAAIIPTGIPMIMSAPTSTGNSTYSAFKVAQDTGSAINGGCHVDVFYGASALAEKTAGDMTAHGSLFVALPKDAAASTPPPPNTAPAPAALAPIAPPAASAAPATTAWPAAPVAPPSIAWPAPPTSAKIIKPTAPSTPALAPAVLPAAPAAVPTVPFPKPRPKNAGGSPSI